MTDIRKRVIEDRDKQSLEEITQKSQSIEEKLLSSNEYRNAENVLIYASMRCEVITDGIILDALSKGKNVFCPKVTDKDNRKMEFVKIKNLDDLEKGYFGIREPLLNSNSVTYEEILSSNSDDKLFQQTLVVMPGVAFDKNRNRLGYGGGFYDTFLGEHNGLQTVALAFDLQVIDGLEVYMTDHDVKPNFIITENMIIK